MSLSNYINGAMLDWAFGGATPTRPTTRYVSLHYGDPGKTGANELVSSGYARVVGPFSAASGAGAIANAGIVTFTNASGVSWTTAPYFGVWTAISGTNYFIGGGILDFPRTLLAGDTAAFAVGALDVIVD